MVDPQQRVTLDPCNKENEEHSCVGGNVYDKKLNPFQKILQFWIVGGQLAHFLSFLFVGLHVLNVLFESDSRRLLVVLDHELIEV